MKANYKIKEFSMDKSIAIEVSTKEEIDWAAEKVITIVENKEYKAAEIFYDELKHYKKIYLHCFSHRKDVPTYIAWEFNRGWLEERGYTIIKASFYINQ